MPAHIEIDYTEGEAVSIKSEEPPAAVLQILYIAWVNALIEVVKGAVKEEEALNRIIRPHLPPPFRPFP